MGKATVGARLRTCRPQSYTSGKDRWARFHAETDEKENPDALWCLYPVQLGSSEPRVH